MLVIGYMRLLVAVTGLIIIAAGVVGVVIFYRHKRAWRYKTSGHCPCQFCAWARGWR